MGSDTNGFINRPRSSSNRSSRLGSSLSKFSPNFGRKDSSNRTRDYIGYDSRDSHSQADDQDAGGGTWAADVKKPAFSGWRDSGASSDEEPPRVSGPAGRARSGTVTPRNKPTTITQPDNPFGSDTFDFSRPADDDIFGDNRGIKLNYNNSSRDGLDEPRRTSMESSHTINSASDSSIDGYGGKGRGSFMFQGNKIKQERAALTQDDFKPAPPARPRTAANSVGAAVALYDFVGQEEGDLSFKKGDRIEILQKPPGEEWWVGKLGLNEGILPKNYVLLDD